MNHMLGKNPTMTATVKIPPSVIKGLSCSTRLLVLWRQLDSDGSGEVSVEEVPGRGEANGQVGCWPVALVVVMWSVMLGDGLGWGLGLLGWGVGVAVGLGGICKCCPLTVTMNNRYQSVLAAQKRHQEPWSMSSLLSLVLNRDHSLYGIVIKDKPLLATIIY